MPLKLSVIDRIFTLFCISKRAMFVFSYPLFPFEIISNELYFDLILFTPDIYIVDKEELFLE